VPTTTLLRELGPAEFLGELDSLIAIYADAMTADPGLLPGRRELMRRHASYPSFRALAACQSPTGPMVGFGYGFHGVGGQWWYDAVRSALISVTGQRSAQAWLSDCIEVAELHVNPSHQRIGIGSQMLLGVTRGRPERTALLSTPDRESPARRLYRRAGFADLLTDYCFPGDGPPYAVMGATLPLRDPACADGLPAPASPSIW
jgi:ribosomal protein S18 acetylase RimI-like enzyme